MNRASSALIITCLLFIQSSPSQEIFFVSTLGKDDWSGKLPAPAADATDGPFATFERARYEIRKLKKAGLLKSGATVFVRAGRYERNKTLLFGSEDSGSKRTPVVWRSFGDETVIVTGGRRVSGWRNVTDQTVLVRLGSAAKRRVVQTNLREQGITDFGVIQQRGSPGLELFFRGERMQLARWPNSGWIRISEVPQTGDSLYNKGLEREKRFDSVPVGRHYGRIGYEGERPRRWRETGNIYLHGYWTWDWSDSFQRVHSIDTLHREITLASPHHHYGYTKNQRYAVLNVLEELDAPGEWFLDRSTGMLYFWPPASLDTGDCTVSMLEEPLVVLEKANHIVLRGFIFEQARAEGIRISGGTGNQIAGCTFRQLGGEAVTIIGGADNTIVSCDLYDLSQGAIRLTGGDRKTLTPGGNSAVNNHIHHFSTWLRTGQYGVFLDGVANRIAHNKIHDAPFEAIYLRGNEHVIEFNEIHDVTKETGDAGALHTGRDWTWRGNVIRHNYFHDLVGPGLHGVMAVYLDDWASGFTVYGNIFYRAGRAAFVGGGRDNTVENNIFIECAPSVHVDARGLGWAGYYFDGTFPWLFERMDEMKFRQPPYSERYPELLKLYDDEPRVPKGNRIVRNISYGGRWMDVYDYWAFDFSVVTVKDNVIADPVILRRRSGGQAGWDPYYLDIDRKEGYDMITGADSAGPRLFQGNLFLEGNPGFVDIRAKDFRLRDDSSAYRTGFKRIPLERIGLYEDELRKQIR
ncbi:MAG: right-handed parallel beta-helix repeat-containing protein [Ignavibacteriales bacterium]|nr:right-handed parallel beta-helix repeat-containing protein [Ignavibacteriales bacterium]